MGRDPLVRDPLGDNPIDARCTYGREAGYQEEEEEEGEAEGDQETLPQAHDQNLPLRSLAYRAGCRRDESRKLRHLITITSPTRQWGSRDVYARPGDNVNTPRPVYGCIYHPMWLSTIRLSVLRLLVTVSYQPNVVYINGQACTCTQISIQSHPNVDPVSPKYRRLLTTIYAPKYRFQQVDICGVPYLAQVNPYQWILLKLLPA